jgi:hypothetical protein
MFLFLKKSAVLQSGNALLKSGNALLKSSPGVALVTLIAPLFLLIGMTVSAQANDATAAENGWLRAKIEYFRAPVSGASNTNSANSAWQKRLVSVQPVQSRDGSLRVSEYPQQIVEHDTRQNWQERRIVELVGPAQDVRKRLESVAIDSAQTMREFRRFKQARDLRMLAGQPDEVRTLVDSGPVKNRIDLVFMGDGYTEAEREKFFSDAARLTDDLFSGQTFSSYLPLFNVHAVFRSSAVTGIGKGRSIDTAYKLYREGNTLRAIFPGDLDAIRTSCGEAPDCDYPVVIANDEFYGGLGGEVAVTTRSPASGTVVLRHELGHNFGRVGEEYDGGGYFGANNSSSLRNVGWQKWLSEAQPRPKAADIQALALGWPWQDITTAPYVLRFKSSGARPFAAIRLSLSGLGGAGAYSVSLDGKALAVPGLPNNDRNFVDFDFAEPLAAGDHELKVTALKPTGQAFLSSMTVHEYGFDPEADPDVIGAFPVFDPGLKVAGYRPTNEACLMRNMLHPWFCPVCQENNWRQLLGALQLADSYVVKQASNGDSKVSLELLGLGKYRTKGSPRVPGEAMRIVWKLGGKELPGTADQKEITIAATERSKKLVAEIHFVSHEIRNEDKNFAQQKIKINLAGSGLR